VAALVLLGGGWCGVSHGWSPIPSNVCKVFKRKDLRPDFPVQFRGLNEQVRCEPDFVFVP
jgi:hypothetical protein